MQISRNLPKRPFSRGSGRITLKNCLRDKVNSHFCHAKQPMAVGGGGGGGGWTKWDFCSEVKKLH